MFVELSKSYRCSVSPEDYEKVSAFKWYASLEGRGTKVYAVRWQGRSKIRMHRFILGLGPDPQRHGLVVDHRDHDSLNNCRENLELITQAENMARSKGWRRKGIKCSTKKKPSLTTWRPA